MLNVQVPHLDFWVGFFVFDLCRYKWVHLMPLSVCGEASSVCLLSSWCYREYTPTQMEGQVLQGLVCTDHLITDWFKKYLFTQLPFSDNKHCNMLCVHCIVKFIKVKNMGGDDYLKLCCWEIKWYTFYRDCIVSVYLFRKISLLNSQGTFYLWIQRFLMKQIPNKNEVMLLNLQKKLFQEV